MNYIKVNHLTKVINNNTVLDDINFELKQGG
ncbi:TPA: multidrug ABC transporter ATP-binding protein, partial [Listeria monocytogenes]|nr:multidrug ABC transporter ATP-binding protein [Listeria monocytogenes]